jgi:TldD protein
MPRARRDFLKFATAGLGAVGALRFAPWILEAEATQASVIDAIRNDLADSALATARKLGATYADVRVNHLRTEAVSTREQQVQNVARNQSGGFGVRVLVNGTWGFAASPTLTAGEARRIAEAAVDIAKANARFQRKRISLAPVEPAQTSWRGAFKKDPLEVPLDDKVQFLLKLNQAAMATKGRQLRRFVDALGERTQIPGDRRRIAHRTTAGPGRARLHGHRGRQHQR